MSDMLKVTMIIPSAGEEDIYRVASEIYQRTRTVVSIRTDELQDVTSGVEERGQEGAEGERERSHETPAAAAPRGTGGRFLPRGGTRPAARRVETSRGDREEGRVGEARNAVVYRATRAGRNDQNTTGVRGSILTYLIARGDKSKRELMADLDMGMKSVEGALHALRTAGLVESIEVR